MERRKTRDALLRSDLTPFPQSRKRGTGSGTGGPAAPTEAILGEDGVYLRAETLQVLLKET